jgi:DNA-binding NarL/FixJ family response regulator
LGRIYGAVGRGFSDHEIAKELDITEERVHGCVSWMLKSLNMSDRLDLVRHASNTRCPPHVMRRGS